MGSPSVRYAEADIPSGLSGEIIAAISSNRSLVLVNGQEVILEESIGKLDDEEVGPFFDRLARLYRDEFENTQDEEMKAQTKHRYRRILGPRYSCLLLTSVALKVLKPSLADWLAGAVRASVEESLQWHREAVLAEALIYYTDGGSEQLLHQCGVAKPDHDTDVEGPTRKFLAALKEYVRSYGSSVRTKAHLKLIPLPIREAVNSPANLHGSVRAVPLPVPQRISFFDDELKLTPSGPDHGEKEQKVGDQDMFGRIVAQHLGPNLQLEDFEVVHYSAGSDAIGDTNVRATAHLYVVFKNQMNGAIALDYAVAMRETLGRLTVAFALDRMQQANEELRDAQSREDFQHRELQARAKLLSEEINNLQSSADKVVELLVPSAWRSLNDWIGVIDRLSDARSGGLQMTGIQPVPAAHNWTPSQYAAALLKLVNYVHEDATSGPISAENAWYAAVKRLTSEPDRFLLGHPMWRCLDRTGIIENSQKEKLNLRDTILNYQRLRDAFVTARNVFGSNGFTLLFVQIAIGARWIKAGGEPAEKIVLDPLLRVDAIVDGMNLLHDTLTQKIMCGMQSVGWELKEGWFRITFQNKRASEFSALCKRIEGIRREKRSRHPGYRQNDMSMSILAALGANEETWSEALDCLEIDMSALLVTRTAKDKSPIACCKGAQDSIELAYKLRS